LIVRDRRNRLLVRNKYMLQQRRTEKSGDFFRRYNLWQVLFQLTVNLLSTYCQLTVSHSIENKFEILLPRFVEIHGFTFLNVKCFSLQVNDNYKTSKTANSSHNFLFFFFLILWIVKTNFLMESTFVSSSEHNLTHIFNDQREELYTKLILSFPNKSWIN
jgi:hypothetical protein